MLGFYQKPSVPRICSPGRWGHRTPCLAVAALSLLRFPIRREGPSAHTLQYGTICLHARSVQNVHVLLPLLGREDTEMNKRPLAFLFSKKSGKHTSKGQELRPCSRNKRPERLGRKKRRSGGPQAATAIVHPWPRGPGAQCPPYCRPLPEASSWFHLEPRLWPRGQSPSSRGLLPSLARLAWVWTHGFSSRFL